MNISILLNRSCEEARLYGQQSVLSERIETSLHYFSIGMIVLLFPFSLSLTSLTAFLILKFKHLYQTTFFLALQLVFFNIFFVVVYAPILIVSVIESRWVLGLPFCRVSLVIFRFIYLARSSFTFVFICDRFFTVFAPFRYPVYRNKFIWSLNLIVLVMYTSTLVVPLALQCHNFDRFSLNCLDILSDECPHSSQCQRHSVIFIVVGQILGCFIPLVMYTALFVRAKQVRNQILPNFDTEENREQRKRDKKANRTFFALFLSLLIVNILPTIGVIINSILVGRGIQPPEFFIVIKYLFRSLIMYAPITDSIIIIMNAEVKKAMKMLRNKLRLLIRRQQEALDTHVTTRTERST